MSDAGETATAATSCATATVVFPDAEPALAETVAVPLPTLVSRPAVVTVATLVSVLAQETETPDMMAPCWSCTVAVSRTATPSALNTSAVSGLMVTVVGTSGGDGGSVGSSPHAAVSSSRDTARDQVIVGFIGGLGRSLRWTPVWKEGTEMASQRRRFTAGPKGRVALEVLARAPGHGTRPGSTGAEFRTREGAVLARTTIGPTAFHRPNLHV